MIVIVVVVDVGVGGIGSVGGCGYCRCVSIGGVSERGSTGN